MDALGVKICELLQVGIDKANIVLPETIQQLILWNIEKSVITLICAVVMLIAGLVFIKSYKKTICQDLEESCGMINFLIGFYLISGILLGILGGIGLIKTVTVPNIVVIEQLSGLIK